MFTSHLTFAKWSSNHFLDLLSSDIMLNRFCLQILPSIHDKVQQLDLNSSFIKHVLCAANYPNLHSLTLHNINEKSAEYLIDQTLSDIFKKQIRTLSITICDDYDDADEMTRSVAKIFDKILNVFINLTSFVLNDAWYKIRVRLTFHNPFFHNIRSSTLSKLIIRVESINDCLYLLDGRYNQLHTFHVDILGIAFQNRTINQDHLPNLKCFSLSCADSTTHYDDAVLPLFRRMSNLEELTLCLTVWCQKAVIDGKHLKTNILKHMPQLNQFTFFIHSFCHATHSMRLPSSEVIQKTIVDFPNDNITSYMDILPHTEQVQCHIYSYPFMMRYYTGISNVFPGGLFEHVRSVSLIDERPFQHEFFVRIQKSFPFMQELSLVNYEAQNQTQSFQSNGDNGNLSVIKYTSLCKLYIDRAHNDYVEEFLLDTKTCLQNNIALFVNYESLQRVTHNFTRDATRNNYYKIIKLNLCDRAEHCNALEKYFSNAKICFRKKRY
ncbi:unnamed protein product [Adineta steineri]|uniref:F-box domain-containing protein n=1 Tax=Adineta steineri TaxID=433720 RepID=A0A814Y4K6_9BILA|nr:unnamed protein product [Adineta steineri]CAF1515969.1 unnamed protein product [Adineta steineri]